ncbi:MAG: glycosyltransferase family 2 protein [Pseudomonadota bacterium]
MKLAAIIVNYRTADLTAQATSALLRQLEEVGDFHLYVVDNDSGDGSVDRLNAFSRSDGWGDRVSVVAAPRNGGYGYGINVAVDLARNSGHPPEYFFILNSDAFADPGAVGTMMDFMEQNPEAGLCGPSVNGTDGVHQGGAFQFPTAASELNEAAKTAVVAWLMSNPTVALPLPSRTTEVEWVSGTCMLVRRAVFDQIGHFDEGFFLYYEEVDFCHRARRAGWRSYCVPAATVTHLGSVSTGFGDKSRPMPRYWFESRHRYLLKHHGRKYTAWCDVCWTTGFIIGETKRALLRRPVANPQRMLRDFVGNSLRHLMIPRAPGPDEAIHVPGGGAPGGARP